LNAGTFSIVAHCASTGTYGVAIASAIPCVGAISSYAAGDAGAVATQAWCNPHLGISGLELLRSGHSAHDTLKDLLASDDAFERRQLGVVDRSGDAAAWTGGLCTPWAGHRVGQGYAVQGNMLAGERVLIEMEAAYRATASRPLSERLASALEAGERAGGDKRGKQSASILVFGPEAYPLVDVRVDDHPRPAVEVRRIHDIALQQLSPFINEMPRLRGRTLDPSRETADLLAMSPPARPGGGGSGPDTQF
jgi:uncharacterized Ntn-hydrolase superfamily protein